VKPTEEDLPCKVTIEEDFLVIAKGKECWATALRSTLNTNDIIRVEIPTDDGSTHNCWVPTHIVKKVWR